MELLRLVLAYGMEQVKPVEVADLTRAALQVEALLGDARIRHVIILLAQPENVSMDMQRFK
jgi:hypothetical protein